MLGIAEIIIIVAIVAFLYFLFRFGARSVIMMVLGGVSLLFVAGLVLVLLRSQLRVERLEQQEAASTDYLIRIGIDEAHDELFLPRHYVPESLPASGVPASGARPLAEVETEIDPFIADIDLDADSVSEDAFNGDVLVTTASSRQRPTWVDEPGGKVAGGVYVATTAVGPFKTLSEAEEALATEVRDATNQYINRLIGDTSADTRLNLPAQYIMEHIVTDAWQEKVEHEAFGSMMNLHARLRFDNKVQADIKSGHENAVVAERIIGTGLGAGILILLLLTVYGYLKLDTATRGYYSGRLRVATAAMILAIVAVGGLLAQSVIGS